MSLLTAMTRCLESQDFKAETRTGADAAEPSECRPRLFVSTDLESRNFDWLRLDETDVERGGKTFRRLTPEYFAWLRSRMVKAQAARQAGKLSEEAWNTLRQRFNSLQEAAIGEFGKERLQEVLRTFSPENYAPPKNQQAVQNKPPEAHVEDWVYPGDTAWKFKQTINVRAVAKVDTVREEAIAKGWSEARMYQNQGRFRFPCGEDYGLVCFLDADDRIGEVSDRYIEIIGPPPRENRLRFYNPDVRQEKK